MSTKSLPTAKSKFAHTNFHKESQSRRKSEKTAMVDSGRFGFSIHNKNWSAGGTHVHNRKQVKKKFKNLNREANV